MNDKIISEKMYKWATDLFPICRSITGPGLRKTLKYIQNIIPELKIESISTGTKAFDWVVPDEWTIRDAFIKDDSGKKIVDFKKNNLHIMGYSTSIDKSLTLDELDQHLYSLPEQPNAIPYVTSYYKKRWGFCLTHKQRKSLKSGDYNVFIDSDLKPGVLNYGEIILKGTEKDEVFLSTYICHPSMANNELSGPIVSMGLIDYFSKKKLNKTLRFIFIPETIGSISYLSKNINYLKENVIGSVALTQYPLLPFSIERLPIQASLINWAATPSPIIPSIIDCASSGIAEAISLP